MWDSVDLIVVVGVIAFIFCCGIALVLLLLMLLLRLPKTR